MSSTKYSSVVQPFMKLSLSGKTFLNFLEIYFVHSNYILQTIGIIEPVPTAHVPQLFYTTITF